MDARRKVLDANAAFTELTGYRLHELPEGGLPPCQRDEDCEDFRPGYGRWYSAMANGKENCGYGARTVPPSAPW
jgi:PAS domain-containing protein